MGWPARKWVRWLLAGFAILLLAVIAFATWLVTTEAGLVRTVALAESLGSVSIRVEGASGRLIGPLHIATITIEHPRASIRIAGLEADYEPLEILGGPDLGRGRPHRGCEGRAARRDGSVQAAVVHAGVAAHRPHQRRGDLARDRVARRHGSAL